MRPHPIFLFLIFSILAQTNLPNTQAHISGGLTTDVGGYRFQFNIDTTFLKEEQEVYLSFSIQNASNSIGIEDGLASVTISKDGVIIKSFEDVEALSGDFVLPYIFEIPGRYSIRVQLSNFEEKPAAEFPLEISPPLGTNQIFFIIGILVAGVLLLVLLIKWRSPKYRREPRQKEGGIIKATEMLSFAEIA